MAGKSLPLRIEAVGRGLRSEAVGRGFGKSDIDLAKEEGPGNMEICEAILEAIWSLKLLKSPLKPPK